MRRLTQKAVMTLCPNARALRGNPEGRRAECSLQRRICAPITRATHRLNRGRRLHSPSKPQAHLRFAILSFAVVALVSAGLTPPRGLISDAQESEAVRATRAVVAAPVAQALGGGELSANDFTRRRATHSRRSLAVTCSRFGRGVATAWQRPGAVQCRSYSRPAPTRGCAPTLWHVGVRRVQRRPGATPSRSIARQRRSMPPSCLPRTK